MARASVVEREAKKIKTVLKYQSKRAELKAKMNDQSLSDEERWDARQAFNKLPRNASPCRVTKRCRLTGRPRGVYKKFGLGRGKLRQHAMEGNIPGVRKASW